MSLTRNRVLRAIRFRTRSRMAGANCKLFANSRYRSYSRTMKWMQLWILTALWLGAGGGNVLGAAQAKIRILTSFPPVYCFTANVAGDLAVVENLLPPGADPHDYSLSPQAARRLAAADLLIVNGLGLESWLQRAFQNVARPQTLVVISAGLENDLIYEVPSFSAETSSGFLATRGRPGSRSLAAPNPHIWLDPVLAGRAVSNILLALQKADPANAAGQRFLAGDVS